MAPETKQPYHPIIWQLICCPLTPFLILFCDILSTGKQNSERNKEALAAMEQLPGYLREISLRSSFAAGLESITNTFVQHAKSVVGCPDSPIHDDDELVAESSTCSLTTLLDNGVSQVQIFQSTPLCSNIASNIPNMLQLDTSEFNSPLDNGLATFTDMADYHTLFEFVELFKSD
jgi:hypothetical protein